MADGGRAVTYAELDRRSLQVAELLRRHGLGPGDRIAVVCENRPEFLEVAWGAQRSGLLYTPVNWHLTENEIAHVVGDCRARVVFASSGVAQVVARVLARFPGTAGYLIADPGVPGTEGLADYATALAAIPARPGEQELEGTYAFYSSGTTGLPKGIDYDLDVVPFGTGRVLDRLMGGMFGFDADSVYLCPAPLYHAAPLSWSVGTGRHGGTVVLMEKFDPVACLEAVERHRVTHGQFVPTMFVRLLKLPVAERHRHDLSSLRTVVHAAAPCPVDVKQQMIDWLGPIVLEYYSASEGGGFAMIDSAEWLSHRGSVGRLVSGIAHVVGSDGEELPVGEVGTVYFEGGLTFTYHNEPDKTAATLHPRGWQTLGDMGHLDADGYLYLADRRTDLIISGGVNIYPAEVEGALIAHPAVMDVAVIGVPDPELGQTVRAVVQLMPDQQATATLERELAAFCHQALAGFKCPRSFVFTPQLPRLPSGKLLRRQVRAEHGAT